MIGDLYRSRFGIALIIETDNRDAIYLYFSFTMINSAMRQRTITGSNRYFKGWEKVS